jgi:hypothetical protein
MTGLSYVQLLVCRLGGEAWLLKWGLNCILRGGIRVSLAVGVAGLAKVSVCPWRIAKGGGVSSSAGFLVGAKN